MEKEIKELKLEEAEPFKEYYIVGFWSESGLPYAHMLEKLEHLQGKSDFLYKVKIPRKSN